MTKEEISKAIEECEKRLTELREELNKPAPVCKRWRPGQGERFFHAGATGDIYSIIWQGGIIDEKLYAFGNVFPSKKAAEFEIERRKVIAELSDFAEGDDAVWDGARYHYRFYYDFKSKSIEYSFGRNAKFANLYFPSEEAAKAAIKVVGEERVKKYYLEIKEEE